MSSCSCCTGQHDSHIGLLPVPLWKYLAHLRCPASCKIKYFIQTTDMTEFIPYRCICFEILYIFSIYHNWLTIVSFQTNLACFLLWKKCLEECWCCSFSWNKCIKWLQVINPLNTKKCLDFKELNRHLLKVTSIWVNWNRSLILY